MNAVEIENVTKTFGKLVAVDDLSLGVPEGSIYGFIGPNGSGKTTTMRIIMNILYPDRGAVRIFGERLAGAVTDRIGYMPEERGIYKRMKVRDVLRFYGELKNGKDVAREVDRWLERLGLAEWGKKKVETLSKGMSQKVQFLAAVIARPQLLILDEPFTGLDPVNADAIREAVLELKSRGATVILSTHDMDVAERMCDFILMIFKGRKVLDGTLESIQSRFGADVLRIRTNGDGPTHDGQLQGPTRSSPQASPRSSIHTLLQGVDGVEKVTDFGQFQELRVRRGLDPHDLLAALVSKVRLKSFEVARPSLHDIFVRIVRSEAGASGGWEPGYSEKREYAGEPCYAEEPGRAEKGAHGKQLRRGEEVGNGEEAGHREEFGHGDELTHREEVGRA